MTTFKGLSKRHPAQHPFPSAIQPLSLREAGIIGITPTYIDKNPTTVRVASSTEGFLLGQVTFYCFTEKGADAAAVQGTTLHEQFAFKTISQIKQRFARGCAALI